MVYTFLAAGVRFSYQRDRLLLAVNCVCACVVTSLRSTGETSKSNPAIVHQRYKLRRFIIVTSNRIMQDWGKYLGDATMASTILDRLMHRTHMLEFEGKSYRLKEAAVRIAVTAETTS